MATYRARACPKCQYYVGFRITRPFHGTSDASIKSFCLNCNYQLPVRAVLRGMKNFPPHRKTPVVAGPPGEPSDLRSQLSWAAPSQPASTEALAQRTNYPRELRAIGQELEKRGFTTFNLKCSGDTYFVWSTENCASSPPGRVSTGEATSGIEFDEPATKMLLDRIVGFLFSAADVKRLEDKGVQDRLRKTGVSSSRRLSHLLRTVGEQVYRRNQRLLAVAWQDHQVSIVSESDTGRREINTLRTDNLYDLWVRMYLQRSQ
jgi:hypothetical protein